MNFDILCRSIEEIINNSICLEYIETNGLLLAKDSAKDKLEILRSCGVDCMLLSISPFHNEYLPVDENKGVYNSITQVFGNNGIFPWHPDYYHYLEKAGTGSPVKFTDYVSLFSKEDIRYQIQNIIYLHPGGRAAFLFADLVGKYPARRFFDKNCIDECSSGVHAHMDFYGNYCAGFCSGMTIGEKSAFNLKELYAKGIDLEDYPILDIVINKNMQSLYEYAKQREFHIDIDRDAYSSPCHLCLHIRTFLFSKYPGLYKELSPDFFYSEMMVRFGMTDL